MVYYMVKSIYKLKNWYYINAVILLILILIIIIIIIIIILLLLLLLLLKLNYLIKLKDIVKPSQKRTHCFTKGYYHDIEVIIMLYILIYY